MAEDKKTRLTDEQRKLVEENTRIVYFALRREFGDEFVCDEDNISEGFYALCRAAMMFDPEKGYKFSSYAYKAVVNRIRYLANRRKCKSRHQKSPNLSLDARIRGTEYILADVINDKTPGPEQNVLKEDLQKQMARLIEDIERDEPIVVGVLRDKRYVANLSDATGVSHQAIYTKFKSRKDRIHRKYRKRYGGIINDT